LWVANFGGNVTEYGPPLGGIAAIAPNIDIFGANTMLFDSTGIAVGSDGDIYVSDETNGMGDTGDIIVFGKSSNGNASPGHEITGIDTELDHPDGIALDGLSENIYVANASGGSCTSPGIVVYPTTGSGDISPSSSIECASPSDDKTLLDVPTGVTLDSSNNIYVSNAGGAVTEYAAGANGNAAPIMDLEGHRINETCTAPGMPLACCTGPNTGTCDKTQLADPQGIALDSSENIYVTNQGLAHDSITFYAADSTGNVPPKASIQGQFNDECTAASMPYPCCSGSGMGTCVDNTGLNLPVGLVVDSQGNIYVANNNGEDILEFAPITSASGPQNVAPIAAISGGIAGLNIPLGITIAPFQ
jgi:hypothetical protein